MILAPTYFFKSIWNLILEFLYVIMFLKSFYFKGTDEYLSLLFLLLFKFYVCEDYSVFVGIMKFYYPKLDTSFSLFLVIFLILDTFYFFKSSWILYFGWDLLFTIFLSDYKIKILSDYLLLFMFTHLLKISFFVFPIWDFIILPFLTVYFDG